MKSFTLSLLSVSLVACAASDADLDEQAIAEGADGKADSIALVRLERATPSEVAASFASVRGTALSECFAGYQAKIDASATKISAAVADKFIQVAIATNDGACDDWSDLSDAAKGVLEMKDATELTPAAIIDAFPDWAKPQLTAASVGGYVQTKELPLIFYTDLMRVREANAMKREKDPTGIDLATIRTQWREVRSETTLDRAYLNPVTFPAGSFEGSQLFKSLRAAFPLRTLTLVSSGYAALDDFAGAHEGPDGDAAFTPIKTALRKSSIKKRFYFARTGEWSSNVLIVIDQHGQAWGMQMGYSE